MRLVAATVLLSIAAGYLAAGRLGNLLGLKLRFPSLALVGMALQVVPMGERRSALAVGVLLLSFTVLLVFALLNVGGPGFGLILVGLVLNFTVIAANQGMPVSREALVASGQQDTLEALLDGSPKHHLAGDGDVLLFLGDVIPLGTPIHQAISVGDIAAHAGAAWLILAGMRGEGPGRTRREEEDRSSEPIVPSPELSGAPAGGR